MILRWTGLSAVGILVTVTIGFVAHSVITGQIVFQGKERASWPKNPFRFALWLVAASIWAGTIFLLALPVIFS